VRTREPNLAAIAAMVQRLAVLLSAGVPPAAAWGYLREDELAAAVATSSETGSDIPDAIVGAASRHATPGEQTAWCGLAAAWAIATDAGAPLAQTLRDFAESLRGLAQTQREIAVALAAPRATARLVLVLPLIGMLFGLFLGFNTIGTLVTTVPGWACLLIGTALMIGALRWNRRLVARAQPRSITPGLPFDLLAIAVSGGASIERARGAVRVVLERFGFEDDGSEAVIDATLGLSSRAGVPAAELLRSEAREQRRDALASAQSSAQALSVRLMIPLGVCVLPAFMALTVVPLLLAVLAQVSPHG
jgi:tight adherence protein B